MAGCEVVFHLGAQVAIPYSFLNPRDCFATNVGGALNVAQAARRLDVQRLIHISTSEVYGEPSTVPIREDHPFAPRSPYAASKASADLLMMSFQRSYGLPVGIVRPFNTYGPHQSARAIVPAIITQALQGGPVRLGRLSPRRDLTFVADTVQGMLALGAVEATVGRAVQLGSGADASVGELVELVGGVLGRSLEVLPDAQRVRPNDSEISRQLSDPSAAKELSGWQPTTDLLAGLAITVEWISANSHRYGSDTYAT